MTSAREGNPIPRLQRLRQCSDDNGGCGFCLNVRLWWSSDKPLVTGATPWLNLGHRCRAMSELETHLEPNSAAPYHPNPALSAALKALVTLKCYDESLLVNGFPLPGARPENMGEVDDYLDVRCHFLGHDLLSLHWMTSSPDRGSSLFASGMTCCLCIGKRCLIRSLHPPRSQSWSLDNNR